MYLAVQADTCYLKDPRELRDNINRNYDELVQSLEAKDETIRQMV
jgi:hypothetical protein